MALSSSAVEVKGMLSSSKRLHGSGIVEVNLHLCASSKVWSIHLWWSIAYSSLRSQCLRRKHCSQNMVTLSRSRVQRPSWPHDQMIYLSQPSLVSEWLLSSGRRYEHHGALSFGGQEVEVTRFDCHGNLHNRLLIACDNLNNRLLNMNYQTEVKIVK